MDVQVYAYVLTSAEVFRCTKSSPSIRPRLIVLVCLSPSLSDLSVDKRKHIIESQLSCSIVFADNLCKGSYTIVSPYFAQWFPPVALMQSMHTNTLILEPASETFSFFLPLVCSHVSFLRLILMPIVITIHLIFLWLCTVLISEVIHLIRYFPTCICI